MADYNQSPSILKIDGFLLKPKKVLTAGDWCFLSSFFLVSFLSAPWTGQGITLPFALFFLVLVLF